MTLQELFEVIGDNPAYVVFFFTIIPFTALLGGWFGKDEGHLTPWKQLYSVLIYLVSIPGIFAVTLNIYLFLFERRSIMDTDVYNQILPIVSMLLTFVIIRKNVNLDYVPGIGKLGALVTMIAATLAIMWFIDSTRIIVFSYVRFEKVILIFIGLLIAIRFGWHRIFGGGKKVEE